MGYGTSVLNITTLHESTDPVDSITLSSLITQNSEWQKRRADYMYMKVNYIKFIFLPENTMTGISYLLANWANNHTYTYEQIVQSDNVKIIPSFRTRNKIFTYIPPNITINGHNLNEFITTSVANNLPGYFYYASDLPNIYRIEINIIFRGSQDYQFSTINENLGDDKIKVNEEIKKLAEDPDEKNKRKDRIKDRINRQIQKLNKILEKLDFQEIKEDNKEEEKSNDDLEEN
jgi:hypothetical protein